MIAGSALLAQSVVPVDAEPHHRPVLENEWVRVLDVRFPAGAESLYHRHALNNVAIRIVGGTTRADPIGGEGAPQLVPTGRIVYHSASTPYVHRVVNVGGAAVHIVDVELRGAAPQPLKSADDIAGHAVEVENEHVRVSRVRVAAGESLVAHTHQRGWLAVVVTGLKPGDVAWHVAGRPVSVGSRRAGIEIVEIEPR
jgi:quercetin dioxygenase-like cupin family protein